MAERYVVAGAVVNGGQARAVIDHNRMRKVLAWADRCRAAAAIHLPPPTVIAKAPCSGALGSLLHRMICCPPTGTISPISAKAADRPRTRKRMHSTPATPGTAWIAASSALR